MAVAFCFFFFFLFHEGWFKGETKISKGRDQTLRESFSGSRHGVSSRNRKHVTCSISELLWIHNYHGHPSPPPPFWIQVCLHLILSYLIPAHRYTLSGTVTLSLWFHGPSNEEKPFSRGCPLGSMCTHVQIWFRWQNSDLDTNATMGKVFGGFRMEWDYFSFGKNIISLLLEGKPWLIKDVWNSFATPPFKNLDKESGTSNNI